jgi:hypothetical protein
MQVRNRRVFGERNECIQHTTGGFHFWMDADIVGKPMEDYAKMYITWNRQDTDFIWPLKLEDKIAIFYERIYGWQLHVADICLNGGLDHNGANQVPSIPHSVFTATQVNSECPLSR